MGEEIFEVKLYGVRYICDDCGGEMLPTGQILMSDPPRYPHKCLGCKKVVNLTEKYPTVRWKGV